MRRVPFRIPTPAAGCLRVSAWRTTPPPPTIGVHPRIVRINTTPPPTQNRPGETQHRRRFVHNRCPAWPPRRPLTLADLRIADNTELTNNGYEPTNEPGGEVAVSSILTTLIHDFGKQRAKTVRSSTSTRPPPRLPTPIRTYALRTTPHTPIIGPHPRIVQINETAPPTQIPPGQTRQRCRFVHNSHANALAGSLCLTIRPRPLGAYSPEGVNG